MAKPKPKSQSAPKPPTRERLLDAAAALLAEVGMERISTNMICERAGLTPPALYHYFANKYDVAAALGERLMERQNAVLSHWLEQHRGGGINAYSESVGELLRHTAEITEAEPGGVWIERALHSTPRLEHGERGDSMKCMAIVIPARFVAGRLCHSARASPYIHRQDLQGPASCAIPPLWAMPSIGEK